MPSSRSVRLLTVVRVVLVGLAVGVAATTVFHLASMPPPPPDSDGFAHGMAAIVGGGILVLSLGLATTCVVLPTVLGRDDPIGFDRRQRLTLKGAGALIGGGVVVGVAYGFVTAAPFGVLLWLVFLVLAALIVGVTLVWRLVAVVVGRVSRTVGGVP